MNSITLLGRLTRDVSLSKSNSANKSYCFFTLAVRGNIKNENGEFATDFFDCVAFGNTAETICKYCKQGDRIIAVGSMQSSTRENNGVRKTYWKVAVNAIEFANSKEEKESDHKEQWEKPQTKAVKQQSIDDLKELDDDEDMPF